MTPIKNADLDNDGIVSTEELSAVDAHNKLEAQTRVAIASFIIMVTFATVLISGLIPESRIVSLGPLISTLFIAKAGIVGAWYGMTGYMSRK